MKRMSAKDVRDVFRQSINATRVEPLVTEKQGCPAGNAFSMEAFERVKTIEGRA